MLAVFRFARRAAAATRCSTTGRWPPEKISPGARRLAQQRGGCSAVGCPRDRSGLGAVRTGDYPCPDESSELGLRAGGGRTPLARVPGPPDERVLCHVLADLREAPPTVSRAILQLQADRAQRFPLPGHGSWSETPVRVTRNACNGGRQRREVRIPMA